MKKTRVNLLLVVFLAGLGLIACVAAPESAVTPTVQSTATASVTITPTRAPSKTPVPASETPTVAPTQTPTPTATPTVAPTQTPTPTMTPTVAPTVRALQGPAIAYNGVSFDVDPDLGDTVYVHDEQMYGAEVHYTRFTLAPDGWCRVVGCVEVYPVEQYQAAFPDRPLPPLGAATILRAQDRPLDFQNGTGARSVRMRGQDVFFANNEALVYDFQGYTDDGRYYVSIIIPIDAPILLSAADPNENQNAAAIPVPTELPSDYGQLADTMLEYNRDVEQQLDQLAPADFTPSLSALDALVASLAIQKPPDEQTLPPVTESRGPFRLVAGLPPELSDDVVGLRTTPDGRVWVATTHSYAVWQNGRWQTTATDFRIQNILPRQDGTIWLAGQREVFIFDGVRWTILTPPDITMTAPLDPELFTSYVLEEVEGQVWIGRCDWGGPGPMGGGGARWYDGTSWQGADAPVATGCVTAIRADEERRVWVAVNADLWRYDPATDVWERLAPPEPPQDYRFGSISDLTFDPSGEPWPLYDVCGGASCGQTALRYRLDDGAWVLVREEMAFPQRLAFDETGAPWLFIPRGLVYRFQVDPSPDALVADFVVHAVTTDADGRIWVVGRPPMGETAVWLLEPDTTPVPPPPQPTATLDVADWQTHSGQGFELEYPGDWSFVGPDGIECAAIYHFYPSSLKLISFTACWQDAVGGNRLTREETYERFRRAFVEDALISTETINSVPVQVIRYRSSKRNGIYALTASEGTVALWQGENAGWALIDEENRHQENGVFDRILASFRFQEK